MMQRKPGFPVANCSIKMPDNLSVVEPLCEEDGELQQRRLQLINFGHSQWGFNNWSWSVTKQELDFAEVTNGKYCAGVVAFVSISVKNLDIHRENIGYATSTANNKGFAIYKSRKVAVTNALRETLLSFGGTVATELMELLETSRDIHSEPQLENNQNIANKNIVPVNLANSIIPTTNLANVNITGIVNTNHASIASTNHANIANTNHASIASNNHANIANTNHASPKLASNVKPLEGPPLVKNIKKEIDAPANIPQAPVKNAAPVAKAHPMPANVPPARLPAPRPLQPTPQNLHPAHPRPNSNVSFVFQPVMHTHPPMYAQPRLSAPPLPPVYPNYYEYAPWHYYEPHGNVNLNFNIPPKNLVVNSRAGSVECKNACREGESIQYAPQQNRGCWIKPTIFYDGFWTEQKVKKWVAEQVEKQFPEEQKAPSPGKHEKQ